MPATNTVNADKWRLAGAGDFNGDGKSDFVWQDIEEGWLALWLMDGTNRLPDGAISFGWRVDVAWRIAAVGDYNRDGRPDLVWRHSSGQLAVWLMDGAAVRQVVSPMPGLLNLALLFAGPK